MAAQDPVNLIGIIASIIGGALGAFSIIVTWKLYQASTELNNKTLALLYQMQQSTHTTEVTATRYTERLVATLIELVERNLSASLTSGEDSVTKRINAAISDQLAGVNQDLVDKVRSRVLEDVKDTFQTMQLQAAAVAQIAESTPALPPVPPMAPGVPNVLRWLARNEKKYEFFSVTFLHERIFAEDPSAQQGLQYCIQQGLVEIYDHPNPKDPAHPKTRACRLNKRHPMTAQLTAL